MSLSEELSLEEKSFSPASVCDRVVCDSLAPFRFAVQYIVSSPSLKPSTSKTIYNCSRLPETPLRVPYPRSSPAIACVTIRMVLVVE